MQPNNGSAARCFIEPAKGEVPMPVQIAPSAAPSFAPTRAASGAAAGDALFGIHGAALQLRSRRLEMIASNIANAATPGYRARDLDFDAALAATSRGDSIDSAAHGASGWRTPLSPSIDGNTVELPVEQTLFAENAVGYRTSLAFLEGRINTITRALKGE